MEGRETPIDTARREVYEETGLENFEIQERFKEVSSYQYKKNTGEVTNKKVIFFLANVGLKRQEIRISSEHGSYKWADYDEAINSLELEGQKQILERANYYLTRKKV